MAERSAIYILGPSNEFGNFWIFLYIKGLSGKYRAILNISRTGRVAFM